MDSGTEVSTAHHREIHSYYLALQKYFNNAETKHDRSNSPRAQKARAKLLKLSASQFYELSTDVYDELQRRISDDQSQPEYLLPKATFHMKRNQARQKLANLSHTRFNDLVDDILFEITRRGYNTPPDPEVDENTNSKSTVAAGSSTPNSKKTNMSHFKNDPNISVGSDGSNSQVPPTATIQTSKVIPQKASIDWSSDEEQDTKKSDKNTNNINTNTPKTNNHTQGSRDLGSNEAAPPSNINALQQPNTTPILHPTDSYHHYGDVIDSPALTETGNNHGGDETLTVNPPKNRNSSTFDFEGVSKDVSNEPRSVQSLGESQNKVKLDQLHSEVEALKKENASLRQSRSSGGTSSSENFEKDFRSLSAEVESLTVENEKLRAKVSELEARARNPQPQNKSSLPLSSDNDKNELEKLALDRESVTRYAAQDGSIPFESVQEFHQYIQKLFTDLQTDVDDIGHTLFEDLARLSNTVAQLFVLVDVPDYKEEVILLKASLSHTITSIRYFSVYGGLLPRITVQAAISELAFAFCNLVRSCKIKGDGRGGAALGRSKIALNGDKSPIDPPTPSNHNMANSEFRSPFDHPTVITKFEDDFGKDEMSPVKPLKITQKAGMSPSAKTPSSARKQSSGFPFGPMVDTRSPASRGKGSSAGLAFEKTRKLNEASPTSSQSSSIDPGLLAARVKDSTHDKGFSKKSNGWFTDSHDRNDPSRTFNGNTTPEKSTATSRATTAEGTTTLSTPLSTASPSDDHQRKLGENSLKETNSKPQENKGLDIQGNRSQDDNDSMKPRDILNKKDNNESAVDSMKKNNAPSAVNDPYRGDDSMSSRDLPDVKNKTLDISDSVESKDISNLGNKNRNASGDSVKNKDSYDSINPFRNKDLETDEEQGFISKPTPDNTPKELLNPKDSKNTDTPQFSTGNIESTSPEEIRRTPEAIKDAISRLEGNSTPDSQERTEPEAHKNAAKSERVQEKTESKNIQEESEPKEQEQEQQPQLQEEKPRKNSGKSFTEKLRTFATHAGIGLKVDKEQKDKQAAATQPKGHESSDGSSDDRKRDITVTDHDKNANLPETGSSTPISKIAATGFNKESTPSSASPKENDSSNGPRKEYNGSEKTSPSFNKDSDDNSNVASSSTTQNKGLEAAYRENKKPTPLEKSLEKSSENSDDSNPNFNGVNSRDANSNSPPHANNYEKDRESGAAPAPVGSTSSRDDKSMEVGSSSKDEPFGKSAAGTMIGDGLRDAPFNENAPDVMKGGIPQNNNATPFVTLNDGNGETDITPRGGSGSLENSSVGQDKEVPSKLPNFYFSNIPQPPTNSNLTDKLKKTFADIPSEDENEEGSDFNNSPYMSDDGSVFRAFKQSLKEENGASRGSPLIQQENFHGSNSEAREKPAGLGLSEKTDLKLNNRPFGIPSGSNQSSNFSVPEQMRDRGHNQDKQRQPASYDASSQNHPKEEFSRKVQDGAPPHKEGDQDISHNSRDTRGNKSDLTGFEDVDDSMTNPGEYFKDHNEASTGQGKSSSASSKNTPKPDHDSFPLGNNVKDDKYKETHRPWDSTDEEDDYDADSFKDAFTENGFDRLEQNSNNSKSKPEEKDINNSKGIENRNNDYSHSKDDSRSLSENTYNKSKGRGASDLSVLPGTAEETNQQHLTSIDEPSDDLNAGPSFSEEKDVTDASAPKSARSVAPQFQPVKLFSSNSQTHDPSNGKAEFSKNDDVTKSPNVPKTPVMRSSVFRPQVVKTPSGKTPSLNSPVGRSPGTRSLASTRTDDGDYTFDVDAFDIENPDNTLSELLLYLEHQSLQVIATIQSLLTSIKEPHATKGNLRKESNAISQVIRQMVDATSISMNQSRNASLKEHGSWVVKSLEDCYLRMTTLCQLNRSGGFNDNPEDENYANKHFKQRLAGIAFDIAKCTKELVKTVEEASLKEEIEFLNSRLN
ncbi:hypothetical protein ZYGR_0E00290 [Zygosaccharomyces rouxii]|uniref:GIT Spa2 homology (SHD) domain-containing protein n=1 Tax=Zygosaccharomyces rouxii TaxID=4956 RepID=A0A1Q2ZU49_ZYGRO|nr:hypothetical protein ZYGR_0E00290 [Zygosaccharomyces rouxii]